MNSFLRVLVATIPWLRTYLSTSLAKNGVSALPQQGQRTPSNDHHGTNRLKLKTCPLIKEPWRTYTPLSSFAFVPRLTKTGANNRPRATSGFTMAFSANANTHEQNDEEPSILRRTT